MLHHETVRFTDLIFDNGRKCTHVLTHPASQLFKVSALLSTTYPRHPVVERSFPGIFHRHQRFVIVQCLRLPIISYDVSATRSLLPSSSPKGLLPSMRFTVSLIVVKKVSTSPVGIGCALYRASSLGPGALQTGGIEGERSWSSMVLPVPRKLTAVSPYCVAKIKVFGTTDRTQRRVSGNCSTTTRTGTGIAVLALLGVWLALLPSFVLGCAAFRSDPCPVVPPRTPTNGMLPRGLQASELLLPLPPFHAE